MAEMDHGTRRFASFKEFWPHYLREHARAATRRVHYAGSLLAILGLICLFLTGNWWFLALMLIGGYGPAWGAHYFIEGNRPATFTHPLWSLMADYKMVLFWAMGRLDPELARAGVVEPASS